MCVWGIRAEVPEFPDAEDPFWIDRSSERIWSGSYKGKDWRHMVCPRLLPSVCACVRGGRAK